LLVWVMGMAEAEVEAMWQLGPGRYFRQGHNRLDFMICCSLLSALGLRMGVTGVGDAIAHAATAAVGRGGGGMPGVPPPPDEALASATEIMFAAASLLAVVRLLHLMYIHPRMGPLYTMVLRMLMDLLLFSYLQVGTLY